ncbi:uncharacterized protein [Chelonus insularis]|uniref:uncharacterized protein n=1 Tax=Chelonus insularis TaxID=460826 RepID=UPI001588F12B|nr:uncharacterized protein LOC118073991 [Chelonus insularis]
MALNNFDSKENYYEQILRKRFNDKSIKVKEILEKDADIEKGTNYCSVLKRLSIKYSCSSYSKLSSRNEIENILHLIIKEELAEGIWSKELQALKIFNIESTVLKKILPKIEHLVGLKIGPTFIHATSEPSTITMDDLEVSGFRNVNLLRGFSESHVLMVMETIAKFHAGSVAFSEKEPKCLEQFDKYFPSDIKHPNFFRMIEHSISYLGEIINEWNDENCIKAAPKIKKLAINICENLKAIIECDHNEFQVLNHGDCWLNNIMFKENEIGEPQEVRLVDYQMCNWSSPAIDLLYFLNLCPEPNIKCNLDDFFITKYLETLNGTMEELKCSRKSLTFSELQNSMIKRKALAQLTGLVYYPKIIADQKDVNSIDEILEQERWGLEVYKNPEAIKTLRKVIPIMNERGYLDYCANSINTQLRVVRGNSISVNIRLIMNTSTIPVNRKFGMLSNSIEDIIRKDEIVFENINWTNIIFEKILQNGLRDGTIQDVAMVNKRAACAKGQNFLSQLWRFSLRYTCIEKDKSNERVEKIIHLILKEEPLPGFGLDYIRENDIFNVELMVFKNVLPVLERLVGRKFAPRFFCGSMQPPTIILEDLNSCGFSNKCRQEGLSKAHMLKAIEAIAQFHAGSVAFNEKQPGYLQSFISRAVSEETHINMYNFLDFIIEKIADKIRGWPEPWAQLASDKLKKLLATQRKRILQVTEYSDDEFCVLNHGDCWITNIMFKEDENHTPIDVRLLDYQLTVWTSPAVDLHYFLNTCPEVKLKVDYDDFFLEKYLKTLTTTMKNLNCKTKPPTMKDIKKSMYKRRIYGIMSGLIFFPRMIADTSDIEGLDECLTKGTTKMDIFKNPRAVKALKKMIPSMLEKGYLD